VKIVEKFVERRKKERREIVCKKCNGKGWITAHIFIESENRFVTDPTACPECTTKKKRSYNYFEQFVADVGWFTAGDLKKMLEEVPDYSMVCVGIHHGPCTKFYSEPNASEPHIILDSKN
jgi:hypothetical protein